MNGITASVGIWVNFQNLQKKKTLFKMTAAPAAPSPISINKFPFLADFEDSQLR